MSVDFYRTSWDLSMDVSSENSECGFCCHKNLTGNMWFLSQKKQLKGFLQVIPSTFLQPILRIDCS